MLFSVKAFSIFSLFLLHFIVMCLKRCIFILAGLLESPLAFSNFEKGLLFFLDKHLSSLLI